MPKRNVPSPNAQPGTKIPAKSLSKAKAAFGNFSLSKFPDASAAPNNFVTQGQQVSVVQRQNQINHLKSLDASGRSLRVALSDSDVKQYLPSLDGKSIVLAELMNLIQTKMRGTEFYVSGNPTLVRLSVQSQAANIIQTITSGSNGGKKG